jgi:hypothetical protein
MATEGSITALSKAPALIKLRLTERFLQTRLKALCKHQQKQSAALCSVCCQSDTLSLCSLQGYFMSNILR